MSDTKKTNEDWKKELPADVYSVTRESGTEAPFTGKFYKHDEQGNYVCSNCGVELFSSDSKFDSGSGWPSFDKVKNSESVNLISDNSHGMQRTEVTCKNCDAHLGHVFEDGPIDPSRETTGQRFCINSLSLDFKKDSEINTK